MASISALTPFAVTSNIAVPFTAILSPLAILRIVFVSFFHSIPALSATAADITVFVQPVSGVAMIRNGRRPPWCSHMSNGGVAMPVLVMLAW